VWTQIRPGSATAWQEIEVGGGRKQYWLEYMLLEQADALDSVLSILQDISFACPWN
jgi:hypothetical protein